MKQNHFLLAIYCWSIFPVAGQTIRGEVRDALSGEPIPVATVHTGDSLKTTTDKQGRFMISAPSISRINVSAMGYEPAALYITRKTTSISP